MRKRVLFKWRLINDIEQDIEGEVKKLDGHQARKCESCHQLHSNRKRKCKCGDKVVNIIDEIAPVSVTIRKEFPKYQSVGKTLKMNRSDVTIGNVIPVNPNNNESLGRILFTLHQ